MMVSRQHKIVILLAALIFTAASASGQDSLWSDSYGGYYNECGHSAVRLSNGDLLLVGSTFSYGSGDYDIYLVKVDSTGTMIWSKTYGGSGTEYGYDIQMTSDSGFVIVGSTTSSGSGKSDLYLIKINASGTELWSKTYGGSEDDFGSSVRMTSDSGFIICGTTSSFGSGTDIYFIKTDSLGDSSWTKTYGGSSGESGSAVRLAADSGYIIIGHTGSYGTGYSSIYLVRTGEMGDTLWTANYGGNRADLGYCVEPTNDKGYILAGATAPDGENFYDAYLIKVDSFGVTTWDSTYGGSYGDMAYSVQTTSDGGYILAGTSEVNGGRKIDIFMVKTDAAGDIEWDSTYGGAEADYCRSVLVDPQGDYLGVGYTYSSTSGGSDVYLIKIQAAGGTAVDPFEPALPSDRFTLSQNFPNPFNISTRIEFELPRRASYSLTIYNVLGQVIRRWEDNAVPPGRYLLHWDGRDDYGCVVASGIYFYQLQAADFHEAKKMVLLK